MLFSAICAVRSRVKIRKHPIYLQIKENKGFTGVFRQALVGETVSCGLLSSAAGACDRNMVPGACAWNDYASRGRNYRQREKVLFCGGCGFFRLTTDGVNPLGETVCLLTFRRWLKNGSLFAGSGANCAAVGEANAKMVAKCSRNDTEMRVIVGAAGVKWVRNSGDCLPFGRQFRSPGLEIEDLRQAQGRLWGRSACLAILLRETWSTRDSEIQRCQVANSASSHVGFCRFPSVIQTGGLL
jgi:hypothetical protein